MQHCPHLYSLIGSFPEFGSFPFILQARSSCNTIVITSRNILRYSKRVDKPDAELVVLLVLGVQSIAFCGSQPPQPASWIPWRVLCPTPLRFDKSSPIIMTRGVRWFSVVSSSCLRVGVRSDRVPTNQVDAICIWVREEKREYSEVFDP